MPSIAFFHGWGLSSQFWGPISLGPSWETYVFDRGYFGEQVMFDDLPRIDLIVAHSYGLHWIPKHLLQSCSGIIALNSFQKFVPSSPLEAVKTKRVLQKMKNAFLENPHLVLEQFYSNVFNPFPVTFQVPDFIHHSLLLHDLNAMTENEFVLNESLKGKKWLIISSLNDSILGGSKRDNWKIPKLSLKTKLIVDGSHAVWVTNQKEIIQSIRTWLKTDFK